MFEATRGKSGHELDHTEAKKLKETVALYRGDLLEQWYHDWCLLDRERFKSLYLGMLDKLIGYCEWNQNPEEGIAYSLQILRTDVAREQTYRDLMRLSYIAGDRTGALRWYECCLEFLNLEIGVQW